MSKTPDSLQKQLAEAQDALARGEISRRDFHKILFFISLSSGLSMLQVEQANAWVATRMRKRSTSASSSLTASGLRFDCSRTCALSRTPAGAGNRTKWSFSCWVKRGLVSGGGQTRFLLFSAYYTGGAASMIGFDASNSTVVYDDYNSSAQFRSTAVFRDSSAWMHVMMVLDTNNAAATERVKAYVNGTRLVNFGAGFSQGATTSINSAIYHNIGAAANSSAPWAGYYLDGVMSETYFVDGLALLPTDFAQVDATTGQYKPKQYSGSFGTNGFYLPFKSNSAVAGSGTATGGYPNVGGVAGLGADHSGNNNHWANASGSSLTVNDQVLDTPLNNFATINPLVPGVTTSNGNLTCAGPGGSSGVLTGTFAPASGKWYFEAKIDSQGNTSYGYPLVGLSSDLTGSQNPNYYLWHGATGTGAYSVNGGVAANYTGAGLGGTCMVAWDVDAGKLWIGNNGTWLASGDPSTGANPLSSGFTAPLFPSLQQYQSSTATLNFGQGGQSGLTYYAAAGGSFKYAPPTGFKAVSTANLADPAILRPSQVMNVLAYTGNGGGKRIGAPVPVTPSYPVSRSIKNNVADTPGFTRAWTGNTTTWTLSAWIKRTETAYGAIMGYVNAPSTNYQQSLIVNTDGTIYFYQYNAAAYTMMKTTNAALTDFSKWYHLVVVWDTTNATAADRTRLYLDGVRLTSFSSNTDPSASQASYWGAGFTIGLACENRPGGNVYPFPGLMAEVNYVEGLALGPSSFAQTDAASGEWLPKAYGGVYGTNGFYLNFSDNSNTTATTLGKDSSPNGNNWTPLNYSVAAGAGNDSLTDSPTNNFCTIDPAATNANMTLSEGNLTVTSNSNTNNHPTFGTIGVSAGAFAYRLTPVSTGSGMRSFAGFAQLINSGTNTTTLYDTNSIFYSTDGSTGYLNRGSIVVASVAGYTAGDNIDVAIDLTASTCSFYKNGTLVGTVTGMNPGTYYPYTDAWWSNVYRVDFGQNGFTPPAGYGKISQQNLSASTAAAQTAPDLVWIKSRSAGTDHALYDTLRGTPYDLVSNSTAAETSQPNGLTAFTKTGFTVGSLAKLNTSGATYVSSMWKKGATPGFDIVADVGTGSAKTIAHSLGAKPGLMIRKSRSSGTGHWYVYHASRGASEAGILQLSNAFAASTAWNSTAPTTSVFSVGSNVDENKTGDDYVTYLWAEVPGFSKFGSYAGNGAADGPFVYTGFRPAWIMVKCYDVAGLSWNMSDIARAPFNVAGTTIPRVVAQTAAVESFDTAIDYLANGFKIRESGGGAYNDSGRNYIYIAFAEAPFKYSRGR